MSADLAIGTRNGKHLPEIFRLTGGALHQMATIVPHLEVDAARMRRNLDATHGLIFAEAVTMAMASTHRQIRARKLLEVAIQQTRKSGKHLREVLAQNRP